MNSDAPSPNNRSHTVTIPGIQYLRGIAALAVVCCHYGAALDDRTALWKAFNFGQNGVHLFFLVSGFVIVHSLQSANYRPKSFFRFLLKRMIRLHPAYVATILLTIAAFAILAHIPGFRGSAIPFVPQQFLAHFFYVVPFTRFDFYNDVFWTLCVEVQFYIFIGLAYFAAQNRVYKNSVLVLFALSSLLHLPNGYFLVTTYGAVFALGVLLNHIYAGKAAMSDFLLAALFLMLTWITLNIGIALLALAGVIVILFARFQNRMLTWLGGVSYSLYLTHALTGIVLSGLAKRFVAASASSPLPMFVGKIMMALFVAWLFYISIERPALRLSKRVAYRKQKKPSQ